MTMLDEKIDHATALLARLADRHGARGVAVAFTGGKDSTIALHLWREVLRRRAPSARPLALSLDTGLKFPEVAAFRDELAASWDIDLRVFRPPAPVLPADEPWREPLACCQALKVEPLRRALTQLAADEGLRVLVTGLRADEHESRAQSPLERRREPRHLRVAPLFHFTEMDVWSYLSAKGLPWCALYDQGYRSLGCVPCTVKAQGGGERGGRNPEKEALLGSLSALGYF